MNIYDCISFISSFIHTPIHSSSATNVHTSAKSPPFILHRPRLHRLLNNTPYKESKRPTIKPHFSSQDRPKRETNPILGPARPLDNVIFYIFSTKKKKKKKKKVITRDNVSTSKSLFVHFNPKKLRKTSWNVFRSGPHRPPVARPQYCPHLLLHCAGAPLVPFPFAP